MVAEASEVDPAEEGLTASQCHRRKGQMQLIDRPGLQILPDGVDAPTQPDVLPLGRHRGLAQSGFDPIRHEMERGSTFHRNRSSRVMSEYKDGRMEWRIRSPPAAPRLIRPGTANGPEHVPTDDPGADTLET